MRYLITGASGSGKSEYAERICLQLAEQENAEMIYLATMKNDGSGEAKERISRHRHLRAGKGFVTIESPYGYASGMAKKRQIVLVECMSNLVANLLFDRYYHLQGQHGIWQKDCEQRVTEEVLGQMDRLQKEAGAMVLVTNEVFSDGAHLSPQMETYVRTLGMVNRSLAAHSDTVVEVVYGLPVQIR